VNILKAEKKLAVISALTEGCSIRSIVHMTGVHKKTIMKLLVEIGTKCEQMMNEKTRGIQCEAVECDEIWTIVGKKEGTMKAPERKANPELGDHTPILRSIRFPRSFLPSMLGNETLSMRINPSRI